MHHILTVDDDPTNRRLLRALLEAEGFSVMEAADGVEALALLEREPIDTIISDVLMPNMDGFRLCLEVRKHPRIGALPFIIHTNTYNSPSDRKLALDAGADDYLTKPAPVAVLLTAMAEAQRKAAARAGWSAQLGDEVDVIKRYNAALVTKLEQRNAELSAKNEELQAGEERFRQLAESIHEVFWLTDPEKEAMLYVSPAYAIIWGRSVESLLQAPRTWLDAIHPEDRERVMQAALVKQARGDYDEEYRIVRPDGAIRWIRDRAFPVHNAAGAVFRIAGVAEDITERKQLEEQFRQAQKMEAIGQLAGGVAHDFNNLLSVILMQVSFLKSEEMSGAKLAEGFAEIHDAAMRAANLTRQLLVFSRRQAMQVRRIDVNEVVAGVLRMVRRIVGEHIAIELRDALGPLMVSGDAGMLEQVIMNLVVNARDAMPHGGRVVLTTNEVQLDAMPDGVTAPERTGAFVRLDVADTGTGIAPEVLPHIFEPFFTTKEVGRGTGLGLATVYGIVQQHQGWIDVSSIVGQGTTFAIYLPRTGGSETGAPERAGPDAQLHGNEAILLVEDEPAVRKIMVLALARRGYRVFDAGTGAAALAIWGEHRDDIDLLLTDLMLPDGMSGRDLAERLGVERPSLRVIYTSGYNEHGVGGDITPVTGEDFLAKPFELEGLARIVRRCLDRAVAPGG